MNEIRTYFDLADGSVQSHKGRRLVAEEADVRDLQEGEVTPVEAFEVPPEDHRLGLHQLGWFLECDVMKCHVSMSKINLI